MLEGEDDAARLGLGNAQGRGDVAHGLALREELADILAERLLALLGIFPEVGVNGYHPRVTTGDGHRS